MSYTEGIRQLYRKMLGENRLLTEEKIEEYYGAFRSNFGPEKLKSLDGEALLDTVFNHGNRHSLVYWLEFKNDEEFPTNGFGGIAGGSAFKFGIFKRKDDGKWIAGSSKDFKEVSPGEAVAVARQKRDLLVKGAEIVAAMTGDDDDSYLKLQQELNAGVGSFADAAWVHKYYHLIYPKRISAFHAAFFQRFYLFKLLQEPVRDPGRYVLDGRFLHLARQVKIPVCCLMAVLIEMFGPLHGYWRIETMEQGRSYWEEMLNNGHVSVGWPELGDLSGLDYSSDAKARQQLGWLFARYHPDDSESVLGKTVHQLWMFVKEIKAGDIVVAVEGDTVAGIGRVTGEYEYREGLGFPHCRKVRWTITARTGLPNPSEGRGTRVVRYRDSANILAVERLLQGDAQASGGPVMEKTEDSPAPLTGIIGRIQGILQRKKQVILYGPPGTGKTYWAERACLELAARKAFGRPPERLEDDERAVVTGDGRGRGLVRMCCFHPSYGYEDFIEGIKPSLVNNQIVFELRPGIFRRLCEDARRNPDKNHYLIIDEINRGDISRIFGELITVIEAGKRGKPVLLPLSGDVFSVPDNVYIVGTMNTADRSIALLDVALRRRFGFLELMPDYGLLEGVSLEGIPLGLWLEELNGRIRKYVGRDARNLQIGHAYFMESGRVIREFDGLRRVIQEDIIPLLEEYCYGDYTTMAKIIGSGLVDIDNQAIRHELFRPAAKSELVSALLETCPDITTSSFVAAEEVDAGPDNESDEAVEDA